MLSAGGAPLVKNERLILQVGEFEPGGGRAADVPRGNDRPTMANGW